MATTSSSSTTGSASCRAAPTARICAARSRCNTGVASPLGQRIPESDRTRVDRSPPSDPRADLVRKNLPEHAIGVARDAPRQLRALLPPALAPGLQEVGEIEHLADVIPPRVPDAVIPDCAQHPAVRLPVRRRELGR